MEADLARVFAPVATGVESFTDPDEALARIVSLYDAGQRDVTQAFDGFVARPNASGHSCDARYPYLGIAVDPAHTFIDERLSYGALVEPGVYGTTLTRPDLFASYYRTQIALLLEHHRVPLVVGRSLRPIPLPFVIEESTANLTGERMDRLQQVFALPDLNRIDDTIANGTWRPTVPGEPKPLALFTGERVDYSLQRLQHYTATAAEHFQRFILLTNYQRYVEHFVAYARDAIASGQDYDSFVGPGNVVMPNAALTDRAASGEAPPHLPQMPAYHLTRPDGLGITMVDIGVGPSNAKTVTDHLAVLRPHCFLMLGHCAGMRRSQQLGDYVLAHGYMREDHVLDADLPEYVPVPPIAEVQVALTEATSRITGLSGREMKLRMRTGTVATTDNRNWELRYGELYTRLNQSRAIAVDMESATIAANGFRFRVPYGTLLCVSDKPIHGEIKLRGMANAFYRERINQHLQIGIEAIRILRDQGVEQLHSRKLRSFDEPAFR
ncbi:AMP nucleosidase [Marinivivus vitaminiproducens]|uniref:AMP nucleosidase n=1 Tax=Marinivivus vitaminiproducens TaxID=3035935 RepID=UPI0027A7E9F4|nr:AMP nucleosidase [Geminicoccaceae bacterium SCSIO 64248]